MTKQFSSLCSRALVALALLSLMLLPASAQPVNIGPATGNGYPVGGQAQNASGSGTTAATAATLAGAVAYIQYICGFSVSPGSATAAIVINVTLVGVGNVLTWTIAAPATAAGATGTPLNVSFTPCLPGVYNSSITVTSGALGAGGINNNVNVWGYRVPAI
jgi:hypothetical protein